MTSILRKISKSKWYDGNWLEENEAPADGLSDLNTSGNKLSFWYIEDDKANLEQVITGLAATRDKVSNFDYVLLDLQLLVDIGVQIENTKGNTFNDTVNTKWHFVIINLTANKITELANAIKTNYSDKMPRIQKSDILKLLIDAVKKGDLNLENLSTRQSSLKEQVLSQMKLK